jgi:hypothetical protein
VSPNRGIPSQTPDTFENSGSPLSLTLKSGIFLGTAISMACYCGAGEVVRVRIKDRLVEHVVSLKDFPQLADIFTVCTGLTPDDAPLLMRDRSVQELYALDLELH